MSELFRLTKTSLYFGNTPVIHEANLTIKNGGITCIIGPSGAGKSTLLRSLNRMNDLIADFHHKGTIMYNNRDIYDKGLRLEGLRREVGLVFQKPCLFPGSIHDNVIFGIRHIREKKKEGFKVIAERTLKAVGLWDEVHNRLDSPAIGLSEGQAQRLAIARALAVGPKTLLLDEPTSSLDHRSARAIETLVKELGRTMTIVIVTHKLEQAKALADDVVFICEGKICEAGEAANIFSHPENIETRCYIEGSPPLDPTLPYPE